MKLKDVLPFVFEREFKDAIAYKKLRDIEVRCEFDGTIVYWCGPHRHVYNWWWLMDGHAVGWNESPSRGWGFCVISKKALDHVGYTEEFLSKQPISQYSNESIVKV